MAIYINGSGCISHQNTIDVPDFFANAQIAHQQRLTAQEPDYKNYVPGNMLRRMSHIIKMGVAAAKISLQQAEIENVDAIITGTGLGCFEDTDKFLRAIIENGEQLLTPTSFIQSTHNTVAGQIALLIKCHNYNFTYTQQGLSFESALIDAQMFLNENKSSNVLLGGLDEAIQPYFDLLLQAGEIKKQEDISEVEKSETKGFCLGEGASFFVLSDEKNKNTKAEIKGIKTLTSINNSDDLRNKLSLFLEEINLSINDVSLVLSGNSGDAEDDKILNETNKTLFSKTDIAYFKNLCGEYFTASAFALWLASAIIEKQQIPKALLNQRNTSSSIKNILIINQYRNTEYSFMCVSSC